MAGKKGEVTLDFSDCSAGMNTADPPNALQPKQVQLARNIFLMERGWKRIPGYAGLSSSPTFGTQGKLLDSYFRSDGTSTLIALAQGKIYSVAKSSNATTELYEITGSGEGWGDSFKDKYFLANGSGCIKLEGSTAYRLGIAAPTGASAAASVGGDLADGDYVVIVSYARGNNLYSYGQSLGTVTLGSGNNTIRITFPNSSDAQVDNKVVWIMAPSSSIYYFYSQTNDNTTPTVDVANADDLDETKNYRILGAQSVVPPNLEGIMIFGKSAYGWVDNILYKSLPATTVYDLERWPDIYYGFPYKILGLFWLKVGTSNNLYVNTNRGIYCLPNGDMSVPWERITSRLHFKYMRTVQKTDDHAFVIGLTNDGVRTFNGNGFSIDLSKDVKNYINNIYNSGSAFVPCGVIHNREHRTEYRLSFCDKNLGISSNNRQLVLNLDTLYWENEINYNAAWEIVDHGFSYSTVDTNGTLFMFQTNASGSQIMKEASVTTDINMYDKSNDFLSSATAKTKELKSRVVIPDVAHIIEWAAMWIYKQLTATATANVYVYDVPDRYDSNALTSTSRDVPADVVFDDVTLVETLPGVQRVKPKANMKGSAFYFYFLQTEGDDEMQVFEVKAYGNAETGRYT